MITVFNSLSITDILFLVPSTEFEVPTQRALPLLSVSGPKGDIMLCYLVMILGRSKIVVTPLLWANSGICHSSLHSVTTHDILNHAAVHTQRTLPRSHLLCRICLRNGWAASWLAWPCRHRKSTFQEYQGCRRWLSSQKPTRDSTADPCIQID